MLFPQKRNTAAKGPKWIGMSQRTWHKRMAVNLFVIIVSIDSFLQYLDEPT